MKLIEGFDSNYRFIVVAAKRARQLQSGSRPHVTVNTQKPTTIAMEEIKAGKVEWSIVEKEKTAVEVASAALEGAAPAAEAGTPAGE